jgi:hypothetical protein
MLSSQDAEIVDEEAAAVLGRRNGHLPTFSRTKKVPKTVEEKILHPFFKGLWVSKTIDLVEFSCLF